MGDTSLQSIGLMHYGADWRWHVRLRGLHDCSGVAELVRLLHTLMDIWIPAAGVAVVGSIVAIGVVRGLRERRRLKQMFTSLAAQGCPTCGQFYGSGIETCSRSLVGLQDLQSAPGAVVWEITCPHCQHRARVTHGADETFQFAVAPFALPFLLLLVSACSKPATATGVATWNEVRSLADAFVLRGDSEAIRRHTDFSSVPPDAAKKLKAMLDDWHGVSSNLTHRGT